jgi:hypothetical protein
MKRSGQFILILCLVVAISSLTSHLAVSWLKIRAMPVKYASFGPTNQPASAFLAGSSLAFHGLDWNRIAESLGLNMQTWMVAGSSPAEWEVYQDRAPQATCTFIVVSAYDMNEDWLCDFHADVVPLSETVRSLRQCGADRPFCKKMLSQYPLMLARKLFPTAGRSDGVMVGIRGKLQRMMHAAASGAEGDAPQFEASGASANRDKITDWSKARLQRRLVSLRNASQGKESFNGPKKYALTRMLQQAELHGKGILIVLPVSPFYHEAFLTPEVLRDFESTLTDVRHACPQTQIIRLDSVASLDDNDHFWDLVHMNTVGQQIATASLMAQLHSVSRNP